LVAAAFAAASLLFSAEPEGVVPELLPSVDEPPSVLAGGPPMAVVPVDGVVLSVLPGVVGPASALDVAPPGEPMFVVPATLPVVEPGVELDDATPLLPSVLEPSA